MNEIFDLLEREDHDYSKDDQSETTVYITSPSDGAVTDDGAVTKAVQAKTQEDPVENNECQTDTAVPATKCQSKKKKIRHWSKGDLHFAAPNLQYAYHPSAANVPRKPHEIFDLFLDLEALDLLTKDTVKYAIQRGNHNFTLSSDEMRVFIGILFLSGYNTVARRKLYWQNSPTRILLCHMLLVGDLTKFIITTKR